MKIRVIGLGFGDETTLPYGIVQMLQAKIPIWLRTEKHPVVSWMREKGIHFQTFDHIYETQSEFSSVYEQIVNSLFSIVKEQSEVIYAVPGHPMVAEKTVQLLLEQSEELGIEVEIVGGTSFLDGVFTHLQLDPIEGFVLLDGSDLDVRQLNPFVHMLIGQVYSRMVASDVKLTLLEVYPPDTWVQIVSGSGIPQLEKMDRVPLVELDHQKLFTDFTSVYIPPIKDPLTTKRRFEALVYLFEYLRSPQGCPWDRKQTHQSLRPYLIEETYEFLEAVANGDEEAMEDELGDVLLQVMLHAQIAKESESFDIYDVIENLVQKMIRRHPHVFGANQATTAEAVTKTWAQIKKEEEDQNGKRKDSLLSRIPQGMPALPMAFQIQKIAAKEGFDWERKEEVAAKLTEELLELFQAKTQEEQTAEVGDLLFTAVNLARFFAVEPETALLDTCYKFKQRFRYLEQKAAALGVEIKEISTDQLDRWWNEAKQQSPTR